MSNLVNLVRIAFAAFENTSVLRIHVERLHHYVCHYERSGGIYCDQVVFTVIRWSRMGWQVASRPNDLYPIALMHIAVTHIREVMKRY